MNYLTFLKLSSVKLIVFADCSRCTIAVISAENVVDIELKINKVISASDFSFNSNDLVIDTNKTNVFCSEQHQETTKA